MQEQQHQEPYSYQYKMPVGFGTPASNPISADPTQNTSFVETLVDYTANGERSLMRSGDLKVTNTMQLEEDTKTDTMTNTGSVTPILKNERMFYRDEVKQTEMDDFAQKLLEREKEN